MENELIAGGTDEFILPRIMLSKIYFIRHGETAWSLSGQHTGRTEMPLTELGEQAARSLGVRLHSIHFTKIFTSPRVRARRTGELTGLAGMEIENDLAEWDYGDYEGLRSAEIRQQQPGWNIYHDGCPNGESPAQISKRADRLILRLKTLTGEVALFSHGHFGRVLAARWIGLPVESAAHFGLNTASLNILGFEPGLSPVPAILLWNAT